MQPDAANDAYEALVQFLYQAPIGLAQTSLDGSIEMANPMSAQLLMPVSPDGNLDNLFDVLSVVAPHLRDLVGAFTLPNGVVCESMRIALQPVGRDPAAPQMLSFNLLKLGPNRLMAVLSDATREVRREQQGLARRLSAADRVDNLTRMPKRAVALERLQRAMEREPGEPGYAFGVLFLNCDRLKHINNAQGHAVGDEVLSMLADRVRTNLRSRSRTGQPHGSEPLAARIGGDEFVVARRRARCGAAPAGRAGQTLRYWRPAAALQRQHGHCFACASQWRCRCGVAKCQHRHGGGQARRGRPLRGV
jgi:GGDEF domain-containing protein